MPVQVCICCGAQFPDTPSPPDGCPICQDERQYVRQGGQAWSTAEEVAATHHTRVEEVEPGLLGLGVEPAFGIGQRALCTGGLLWDCIAVLDDAATRRLIDAGGVDTIAISHPHYYTGMADLAERLDARILLHEADRQWITRPTDRIELWSGDHHVLGPDLELIRLGGHFDGGTICLWRSGAEGRGALLTGDIVQVVADHDRVSFMYSFPCFIPLPAREILRMRDVLAGLVFDRVHGAWWGASVQDDAKAKVLRSADRYLAALR